MSCAYISSLFSEDFLPGLLVLNYSLKKVNSRYGLGVLTTPNISQATREIIIKEGIEILEVGEIENPALNYPFERFKYMYSKLNTFSLIQYEKVVYIDSDILVCNNIDDLFNRPHMSASNTGGMIPQLRDWDKFNAGFMVIIPDKALFDDLILNIGKLPSSDKGDQGFLHSYFPNWSQQKELHLCHGYNMYVGFVSGYMQMGYSFKADPIAEADKVFRVLHYWGPQKPWNLSSEEFESEGTKIAFRLWHKVFLEYLGLLEPQMQNRMLQEFPFLQSLVLPSV